MLQFTFKERVQLLLRDGFLQLVYFVSVRFLKPNEIENDRVRPYLSIDVSADIMLGNRSWRNKFTGFSIYPFPIPSQATFSSKDMDHFARFVFFVGYSTAANLNDATETSLVNNQYFHNRL